MESATQEAVLPPDVRKGLALPGSEKIPGARPPPYASLCEIIIQGVAQNIAESSEGRRPSAHQVAKPVAEPSLCSQLAAHSNYFVLASLRYKETRRALG